MRDASGAVVCGRSVTSGFHGTAAGAASRARASTAYFDVGLSLPPEVAVLVRDGACRSELRFRAICMSRVVITVRSIRRSSEIFARPPVGVFPLEARPAAASAPNPDGPGGIPVSVARLLDRGLPDAVRLCDVLP